MGPAWRAEDATLCRYITRPAVANERLQRNRAGDVVLQLKTPYQDGTTHIVMSPLEFLQRLAALSPAHGSISFASMACSHPTPSSGPRSFQARPSTPIPSPRTTVTRLLLGACAHQLGPAAQTGVRYRPGTLPPVWWPLEAHRAIEDPPVIAKILTHLGWSARAPPRAPTRAFDRFQLA